MLRNEGMAYHQEFVSMYFRAVIYCQKTSDEILDYTVNGYQWECVKWKIIKDGVFEQMNWNLDHSGLPKKRGLVDNGEFDSTIQYPCLVGSWFPKIKWPTG